MRWVVHGCPERFYLVTYKCYQIIDFVVALKRNKSSKKLSILTYSKAHILGYFFVWKSKTDYFRPKENPYDLSQINHFDGAYFKNQGTILLTEIKMICLNYFISKCSNESFYKPIIKISRFLYDRILQKVLTPM